jgi:hypothetical protein
MTNPVKENYENGKCPDCNIDIPNDVIDGVACLNCDHIFWGEVEDGILDPNIEE